MKALSEVSPGFVLDCHLVRLRARGDLSWHGETGNLSARRIGVTFTWRMDSTERADSRQALGESNYSNVAARCGMQGQQLRADGKWEALLITARSS